MVLITIKQAYWGCGYSPSKILRISYRAQARRYGLQRTVTGFGLGEGGGGSGGWYGQRSGAAARRRRAVGGGRGWRWRGSGDFFFETR